MKRLVCGVGINDADYLIEVKETIGGKQKRILTCPFYRAWKDMIKRCYSEYCQARNPTYAGCSVTPEWLNFSAFRSWMIGKDWVGKELDKDILHPGNKVYGPDICVFVTHKLNSFTLSSDAKRGEWPLGVSFNKKQGKFESQCKNPFTGKREYLGSYKCPQEAHEAWRKRKHEHACRYADMQTDQRIAEALRKRYAKSGGQDE